MEQITIDLISHVKKSNHRLKVLSALKEKNGKRKRKLKLPSEIARENNMPLSDVSRALRYLKEKGLVKCLNEQEKQGRLYIITKLGENVFNNI